MPGRDLMASRTTSLRMALISFIDFDAGTWDPVIIPEIPESEV